MFLALTAEPCLPQTGCRAPRDAKEPRTTRSREGNMAAHAPKKFTPDAVDRQVRPAVLLDERHSEQLTALLKTMAPLLVVTVRDAGVIVKGAVPYVMW